MKIYRMCPKIKHNYKQTYEQRSENTSQKHRGKMTSSGPQAPPLPALSQEMIVHTHPMEK